LTASFNKCRLSLVGPWRSIVGRREALMSLNHLYTDAPPVFRELDPSPGIALSGHPHFWRRAMSRRQFVRAAGGTAATSLALGSSLFRGISPAWAGTSTLPRPIKGGIQPFGPGTEIFHLFLPGQGNEPSTIGDFKGVVGLSNVSGAGTGIHKPTGSEKRLVFDADCRFMQGNYIGRDGELHSGTFGFI
jgi:hypothetical protein